MSPERSRGGLRAELGAKPCDARVVEGDLDAALARVIAAREALARDLGARDERARAAAALDAACERLDRAREEASAEIARAAVEIALEIARSIVRTELASGRHAMERMVREALALSGVGRGACVVHVSPLDAEALASVPFRSGTRIEADETVARGDVHVSTPHGVLVREVDEALRAIAERLRGEVA